MYCSDNKYIGKFIEMYNMYSKVDILRMKLHVCDLALICHRNRGGGGVA